MDLKQINLLKQSFSLELTNILNYWRDHAIDEIYGGFSGKIDEYDKVIPFAAKGSVLNARILWSFSASYNLNHNLGDLTIATYCYDYFINHFIDKEQGGVYWTVDYEGKPLDTKKQIYALSFSIYALSEYYKAANDEKALMLAQELYADIEKYSYDTVLEGYFEAFANDWTQIEDLRLSDKDANEKKTMNTHLHILEAYTNLYKVWPDEGLRKQIIKLITVFNEHIINNEGHLNLFFDEFWNSKSNVISYGHDIEASWLLLEAAIAINDDELISVIKSASIKIANASLKGVKAGSMIYEFNPKQNHYNNERHWWVQAEALVGFYNAWELTQQQDFLDVFLNIWSYTQEFIIDKKNGEWFWGRNEDGSIMQGEDKAGLWKCPYHNSRACIELLRRLDHPFSNS
jgi:mannobiose 2-epimerase